MNTAKLETWHRTSPLAAIFYLGRIYQEIAKNAIQYLAPLAALLFAAEGSLFSKVLFGIVGFFFVTVAAAFVRYWYFSYRISDDSVLIRDGVIKKTQLDIKFDRIQAISTQQNIIYRAFDLITVKLDTAGSAKQEGHLPAVKLSLSNTLKERIQQESSANNSKVKNDFAEDGGEEATRLLQLGNKDMVRIGLSSNRALLFLAFLAPVWQQFKESVEEKVETGTVVAAAQGVQADLTDSVSFVILIVVGVLLFLVIASIVGAFLRYHKFTLVSGNEGLRSTAGLLTRHEHAVNFEKIQSLVASQNIVQRLFKCFRLQAKQASSGKAGSTKNFIIPLCEPQQLPKLSHTVFGDEFPGASLEPTATAFRPVAKQYIRSRFILAGILPATVVTALMSPALGAYTLVFLLWLPISAWAVWHRYKRYGVLVTQDGIAMRRGFLGYRVTSFLHRKVQRVSVTQTVLQRRKKLATLRFFLASGSVKIPYVDNKFACALRDHVLYKVESSQRAWH